MSVSFDSGLGLFTWGENLYAQVTPADKGAVVHVHAVAKVPGQLGQMWHLHKVVDVVFADLADLLGSETSGGARPGHDA